MNPREDGSIAKGRSSMVTGGVVCGQVRLHMVTEQNGLVVTTVTVLLSFGSLAVLLSFDTAHI